jgi:endonuclease/exonuclease/phosphatase family metal-dependent hydrolase
MQAPVYDVVRDVLAPRFPDFARCRSTAELRALPCYREVAEHIRAVLHTVTVSRTGLPACTDLLGGLSCRVVAWNIERGTQFAGQLEAFRRDSYLRQADVVLLVETDVGMARSGNRDVARTLAEELGFAHAFAPCYLSLVKGSGVEYEVAGANEIGLHGNAILSRYPIRRARAIRLDNGIDKMKGREKRIGSQAALAAEIELPSGPVNFVSIHLDAHSSQRHRMRQMRQIADALEPGPAVLGGDWNTMTYDTSHALFAIVGFWRRVLMGVDFVIRNHYLHPERWFERPLFRMLERRGFDYREANVPGEYTSFYALEDLRAAGSLAEWVPGWCFPFMRWALREHEGRCPFKLDWFATRGLRAEAPAVLHGYHHLSDHDPIGIDIRLP